MLGFYFSPMGRISRKSFWLRFTLVYIGFAVAGALLDLYVFPGVYVTSDTGPASAVVNVVWLWPQIAITSKRFHDRGMSGWWQVLFNVGIGIGGGITGYFGAQIGADGELSSEALGPVLGGLALLAIAGIVELVILGFMPGTKGSNKYGDDPLNPTKAVVEVFS